MAGNFVDLVLHHTLREKVKSKYGLTDKQADDDAIELTADIRAAGDVELTKERLGNTKVKFTVSP